MQSRTSAYGHVTVCNPWLTGSVINARSVPVLAMLRARFSIRDIVTVHKSCNAMYKSQNEGILKRLTENETVSVSSKFSVHH